MAQGKFLGTLIKHRRWIHGILAAGVMALVMGINTGLFYVLGFALITGIFFGKTFCKWFCPLGFMMETLTSKMGKNASETHQYNYYKVGCPVSWVQGALNRVSFFKIRYDKASCTACGQCDKACYISAIDENYSFYKAGKDQPGTAVNCSKCLKCVATCPKGSLHL